MAAPLPVEVWRRILLSSIDFNILDYVAKTITPPPPHRPSLVGLRQRRSALRLVCKAWKEFADEYEDLVVSIYADFNSSTNNDDNETSSYRTKVISWELENAAPPVVREAQIQEFRECLEKARSLEFLTMVDRDLVRCDSLATLLKSSTASSTLQSLNIHLKRIPTSDSTNYLLSISHQLPNLLSLSFLVGQTTPHNDNNRFAFAMTHLEYLRLDLTLFTRQTKFDQWNLPQLHTLVLQVTGTVRSSTVIITSLLGSVGQTITRLVLGKGCSHTTGTTHRISWSSIPTLKELEIHDHSTPFQIPLPSTHPLLSLSLSTSTTTPNRTMQQVVLRDASALFRLRTDEYYQCKTRLAFRMKAEHFEWKNLLLAAEEGGKGSSLLDFAKRCARARVDVYDQGGEGISYLAAVRQ